MAKITASKVTATPSTTPTTIVETRTIFINNEAGDKLGFLNLSNHFEESAYDKLVHWINTNDDKVSAEIKTNSKGQFVQLTSGTQVLGFMNSPKNWAGLEASMTNDWDIQFHLAVPPVTEDNIDDFLSSL